MTRRPSGSLPSGAPRMTLLRALRSEAVRLRRSPVVIAHLVCGIVGGVACGAYFAVAAWDPLLGTDAFTQFLGALMPLMTAIACSLAIDEERTAGHLANLTSVPSRGIAGAAAWLALVVLGAFALALAFVVFGAILCSAGRLSAGPAPLVLGWVGALLGSLPTYVLALALSLRLGRNATIGVGAGATLLAFFSVGGLAHGLMTGELTGLTVSGVLAWVPTSWAARLGSLGVEVVIDAGRALVPLASLAAVSCAFGVVLLVAFLAWLGRFEEGRGDD